MDTTTLSKDLNEALLGNPKDTNAMSLTKSGLNKSGSLP